MATDPKKIIDLRRQAADVRAKADAILAAALDAGRGLTAEEKTAFDGHRSNLDALVQTIEAADALAATADPGPGDGMESRSRDAAGDVRVGDDRAGDKPFRNLGEQLLAVAAASRAPIGTAPDARLLKINSELRAASGMAEGVPSDGGFAVQTDFATTIIGRIFADSPGSVAARVFRVPIGPNANGLRQTVIDEKSRANGSRWGGVQAYWAAEADTVTATKPKLRKLEMDLEKLFGLYYMTSEVETDAPALATLAERAFAEELTFKLEDAIINGTGSGHPLGILNSPALVSQAIEATQTIANTATFIAANTSKMLSRFNGNISRAVWLYNREIFPKLAVATLGGTSVPVFVPGGAIANAPFGTLWGVPLVPVEYCAAEGTPGDLLLADLGWYMVIDKGGATPAYSMHVRFLNDEGTFRVTMRVNGQPIPASAITPFKGSATTSPFVALATRS